MGYHGCQRADCRLNPLPFDDVPFHLPGSVQVAANQLRCERPGRWASRLCKGLRLNRAHRARAYIPYSKRRIKAVGKCASRIWRWVTAISYSTLLK